MEGGPNRQYHPPAAPTPISPYVYGFNAFGMMTQKPHTRWGILRNGGDGTTDWNWTNDWSNSAADYCFNQEGDGLIAGKLITTSASADGIPAAQDAGIAYIATVPNVDFVAGPVQNNPYDQNGGQGQYACGPCPGTLPGCAPSYATGNDSNTCNFPLACDQTACAANIDFVPNAPRKGSAFCTCAGSGCGGCQVDGDGGVFQDELVNYLKLNYGAAGGLFFMLDNEPNYWVSTHPEVWPSSGTLSCQTGTVTFDEVVSRNIAYASAIKSVWPETKVFGPVVAQDGVFYAGDYSDSHLPTPFLDYYLGQMADAGVAAGTALLDSFDIHFYTVASNGPDCLQMPRSFWDLDLGKQYSESQLWNIWAMATPRTRTASSTPGIRRKSSPAFSARSIRPTAAAVRFLRAFPSASTTSWLRDDHRRGRRRGRWSRRVRARGTLRFHGVDAPVAERELHPAGVRRLPQLRRCRRHRRRPRLGRHHNRPGEHLGLCFRPQRQSQSARAGRHQQELDRHDDRRFHRQRFELHDRQRLQPRGRQSGRGPDRLASPNLNCCQGHLRARHHAAGDQRDHHRVALGRAG